MIRQVSTKRHDMNDNEKTHNDKENKLVFSNKMPNYTSNNGAKVRIV